MAGLSEKTYDTAARSDECLEVIQNWFKARCERDWVHHVRFDITTTDNPGWLANFELYTTEAEADSILADAIHRKDVDVSVKNGYIRIYSESLSKCLEACASMVAGAEQPLVQNRLAIASSEYPSTRTLIGWIEEGKHPRWCDNGEIDKTNAEVSSVLRVLGYSNSVSLLFEKTVDFNQDVVRPREPYATTLILVRTLPIKPVELPCPRTGLAVYEQREDRFVLASSACMFHEDGKIAIKSTSDKQGNDAIHYWLKIRDIMSTGSVNVVSQT